MSHTIEQRFSIPYEYNIYFTQDLFARSNKLLLDIIQAQNKRLPAKIAVLIDSGVQDHHTDLIEQIKAYAQTHHSLLSLCAEPLVVTGGESTKNTLDDVQKVLELINDGKVDRHAFIIAIGGGAVLDMAGFAAAIGHRGIGIIRVPTTVLAQNDSGVGVKNSINFFGKKNFLGTFAPPIAVINDSHFLASLDDRQWRAGISEAIKVALIKDATFYHWIEDNAYALSERSLEPMQYLIHRCAEMHVAHIGTGGDPFEKGSSRPLDFGHWAAHKLEQLTNFEVLHGEAVAMGICLDVVYSYLIGWVDQSVVARVVHCFKTLGFETYHPMLSDDNGNGVNPILINGLEEFREHLGGQLTIMLIDEIGHGVEVHEMNSAIIAQAVDYLKATVPQLM